MPSFEDLNADQTAAWERLNNEWAIETWRTSLVGSGYVAYCIVEDGDELAIYTDGTAEWTTGEGAGLSA